jgi:hypothetical protein
LIIAMPEMATKFVSACFGDGMPAAARRVIREILAKEGK